MPFDKLRANGPFVVSLSNHERQAIRFILSGAPRQPEKAGLTGVSRLDEDNVQVHRHLECQVLQLPAFALRELIDRPRHAASAHAGRRPHGVIIEHEVTPTLQPWHGAGDVALHPFVRMVAVDVNPCLLYTSDAADEL